MFILDASHFGYVLVIKGIYLWGLGRCAVVHGSLGNVNRLQSSHASSSKGSLVRNTGGINSSVYWS